MDEPPRNDKSLQASFLITLIFMVVLVALGLWLHPEEEKQGLADSNTAKSSESFSPEVRDLPIGVTAAKMEEKPQLEACADCRLLPSPDNDADSFWVACGNRTFRISLYYADAPDAMGSSATDTKDIMGYFRGLSEPAVRRLADMSKRYVLSEQLMARDFEVLTRWQLAPEESTPEVPTYRAYVVYRDEKNRYVNLSTWLVRQGLARIDDTCTEPAPPDKPHQAYLEELLTRKAGSEKDELGGWSHEIRGGGISQPTSLSESSTGP